MCIFHKWEKWSEVKVENWAKNNYYRGMRINTEPIEYIRQYQDRYCEECGKYQKRYLDNLK